MDRKRTPKYVRWAFMVIFGTLIGGGVIYLGIQTMLLGTDHVPRTFGDPNVSNAPRRVGVLDILNGLVLVALGFGFIGGMIWFEKWFYEDQD